MTTLIERYETIHKTIMDSSIGYIQEWVDSGAAWQLEGHVGRITSDYLAQGALVLSPNRTSDYWGSSIPAYTDVKDELGSSGSVANAESFWNDPDRTDELLGENDE